jgi:AcrR family transcriptional regulator
MSARNPFQAPQVKSRRGGPAKEPLSRDAVVDAALDLLTREGPANMSLRKVAAALDTGPATLYAYVEDVEELQALVLDRALGEVKTFDRAAHDWRHRLASLLESYFNVLSSREGLAQLAINAIAVGPNALRIIEALLGLLDEGGVERTAGAWAVDLLLLYATAVAAEQSQRAGNPNPLAPAALALSAVSASSHPRIHAVREQLVSGDGAARFHWALEVLLRGILETPRAQPPRPAPARRAGPAKPARPTRRHPRR